jgi:hypothetical protein
VILGLIVDGGPLLSVQNDDSALGAMALALVAHFYRWELPSNMAVEGCLLNTGALSSTPSFTPPDVSRAQKAGVRKVFIAQNMRIPGAKKDPPAVRRVRSFWDMLRIIWGPPGMVA